MTRDTHRSTVRYLDGDRFTITIRDHDVTVDQPEADGGEDAGPTPTELFVAGLASCVGFYARRYLGRHGLPSGGLRVDASWAMGSRPARVVDVQLRIDVPSEVPPEHRQRLLAVASHCTVHNSLIQPPGVSVFLTDGDTADAGAA